MAETNKQNYIWLLTTTFSKSNLEMSFFIIFLTRSNYQKVILICLNTAFLITGISGRINTWLKKNKYVRKNLLSPSRILYAESFEFQVCLSLSLKHRGVLCFVSRLSTNQVVNDCRRADACHLKLMFVGSKATREISRTNSPPSGRNLILSPHSWGRLGLSFTSTRVKKSVGRAADVKHSLAPKTYQTVSS